MTGISYVESQKRISNRQLKIGNVLPLSIVMAQGARNFAQFFRITVSQVNPVDDADDRGFNCHVLIANGGTRSFAICAHHSFSRAGTETVGHHDHVLCGFVIQVVWMNDEKTDAFEIGRLLG
jgi:hypothetical protein